MSNKKKLLIVFCSLFVVLATLTLLTKIQEHIPANASGTVGNTAGNLNQLGLFCEHDGTVYFSNAYDNGRLYSMNLDGSNMKKLGSARVQFINADDNYLYFYQPMTNASNDASGLGYVLSTSGLHRSLHSGQKVKCIARGVFGCVSLMDNDLYIAEAIEDAQTLQTFKLSRDGKEKEQISDFSLNPACCVDGRIYYNGTQNDHNLYYYENGSSSMMLEANMWNPVIVDGYVYFMDLDTNYSLARMNLSGGEKEILYDGRIESFNVNQTYAYFQTVDANSPGLYRVSVAGGEAELVFAGNCGNLNLTSAYLYFTLYNQPTPIYMTPATGSVNVTTFDAARDLAIELMNK